MKGDQYKCTVGQSRMGKLQPRLIDLKMAYEQNIQIQRSWPVGNRCRTVASEFLFDFQQFIEQCARFKFSFQRHNRIHKPRLLREPNWLGFIKRRPGRNAPQFFQTLKGGSQRRLRGPSPTGQVRTQRDVRGQHPFRLTPVACLGLSG